MKTIVSVALSFGLTAAAHATTMYNVSIQWKGNATAYTQTMVVADDSKPAVSMDESKVRLLVETSTISKAEFDALRELKKVAPDVVFKCEAKLCSYGVPQDFATGQQLRATASKVGEKTLFEIGWASNKLEDVRQIGPDAASLLPIDAPAFSHHQYQNSILLDGDHGKFVHPTEGSEPLVVEITKVQN